MESLQGTVILIYSCDEWKSRSSMRLIMVSDTEHLPENLKKIKFNYDYTDDDMETYIFTEKAEINELY